MRALYKATSDFTKWQSGPTGGAGLAGRDGQLGNVGWTGGKGGAGLPGLQGTLGIPGAVSDFSGPLFICLFICTFLLFLIGTFLFCLHFSLKSRRSMLPKIRHHLLCNISWPTPQLYQDRTISKK
jgi:hypothetical protein